MIGEGGLGANCVVTMHWWVGHTLLQQSWALHLIRSQIKLSNVIYYKSVAVATTTTQSVEWGWATILWTGDYPKTNTLTYIVHITYRFI